MSVIDRNNVSMIYATYTILCEPPRLFCSCSRQQSHYMVPFVWFYFAPLKVCPV